METVDTKNKDNCDLLWELSGPPVLKTKPDVKSEWKQLQNRLGFLPEKKVPFYMKINIRRRAFAVALTIICFAAVLVYHFGTANSTQTIRVPFGKTRTVKLSDGSTVQLNSGSTITYKENFDKLSRSLNLDGEAFFTVSKEERTFVVTTVNANTTVLGTRFNVWARDSVTKVTVYNGLVKFASLSNNSFINLEPGETSLIIKDAAVELPLSKSISNTPPWTNGILRFEKTNLVEIVGELERFYDVRIQLNSGALDSMTMTGTFENMSIDQVLSSICLTLDLEYQSVSNTFILSN